MSKMRKLMSLLMAAVMVLSVMTVNVFAAKEGRIIISNTKEGETYEVYKVFDLETFSGDNYSYRVTAEWADFFEEGGDGAEYITVDEDGYIVTAPDKDNEPAAAALAELISANLSGKSSVDSAEADSDTVVFTGLDLGYYLVTSTYGSSGICALTTTDNEGTVADKNTVPDISKFVKEDDADADHAWGEENDAERGQTVKFKISVKTEKDADGYVVSDELEDGLTLDENSIEVTLNGDELSGYDIETSETGFEIRFGTLDCDINDEIIVTYEATVDSDADTNTALANTAVLTYDDDNKELDDTTYTYTWEIPVFKYTGNKEKLAGAKFVLKNTDDEYYAVDDDGIDWVTDSEDAVVFESGDDGRFTIEGLDSDTYYLEEKEAPAGYNKLTEDIEIVIDNDGDIEADDVAVDVVEVENNTGHILPETGGIGTMIFRVGGAVLIIAAAVLLAVKKRTNNI